MKQEKYVAYVGTYTHENSVGIHIYDVDTTNAGLKERKVVPINNPSDLVVSKDRRFLYSIADEGVESFQILPDGDLKPINKQAIGGIRGCYVEVDDENRYLFVAGHHDGRVTMMHLNEDGSIGDIADGIFHKGTGRSIAQRNFVPHVDCVKLTPDQKFLCAVDNGLDQTKVYKVDYEKGKLTLVDIVRGPLESAPRMIRFSRDHKYAYILYELLNIVEVYAYSVEHDMPKFEKIQTISTKEKGDDDSCAASGMEISKSGKYLFCSNAGVDSVNCFEIDEKTGMLTEIFNTRVYSDYPKMLAIYPDEKHYLTLNNGTNEIVSYQIDFEKKCSLEVGKPVKVDKPNSIYILKLEQE
ncbi:MAG: lactonase family protein [Roseburia sp.]|uniref:lactonase family protein n=1 Tax=Roseburia sp. 831b TaxID=1261635 RepID=UPI000951FDFA|nr:beta-propeller fold lactonase family protein [Roseburia sp. 831b]MCI5919593.1 lactonase family protein [Roseburia sp.]MDY5883929.1 beta-propeller fold lactonase family protein [Roseburia sp.]WVK73657.1 beta-propeller fold lactonase family protein [Roseburia sp. 831b]